ISSERRSLFAFGSCRERLLYSEAVSFHCLGLRRTSVNHSGVVEPMTYNIQNVINDNLNKNSISPCGYTLGARTAHRIHFRSFYNYTSLLQNAGISDPGVYQHFVNRSSNHVKLNKKPFNQFALGIDKPCFSLYTVG
ncbi:Protein pitchfork, partial [Schistosoma japonicum]